MQLLFHATALRHTTQRWLIYLAVPMGLAGGLLLAEWINISFGKRLMFPGLFIPALFIFIGCLVGLILVWVMGRGKIEVCRMEDGQLQIEASFPNGESYSAKGKWICTTTYIKVYARYGMYNKHLAIGLFCEEQPFLLLRQQKGALQEMPDGFVEVRQLLNPGAPEIWCKHATRIVEIIREK